MKRIFVRGLSRSGGTLMVTILDAHPEVAMCYEVYEHLLTPDEEDGDGVDAFRAALNTRPSLRSRITGAPAVASNPRLGRFVSRAMRGGINQKRLLELLADHTGADQSFATFRDRLQFIERLALDKARGENKQHWGAKITSSYRDLLDLYPDAVLLFMLRDGRDIAASRKNVGDFKKPVNEIAAGWTRQIDSFQKLIDDPAVRARFVHYEALTSEPEAELRDILAFADLPWADEVLQHDQQDLTLFRNPTGHLSGEQVRKPIGTSSVGRWKTDLTAQEIELFESVAGECLTKLGYTRSGAS